jgi:hypothetical protein
MSYLSGSLPNLYRRIECLQNLSRLTKSFLVALTLETRGAAPLVQTGAVPGQRVPQSHGRLARRR